ncbi:hypothetical protein [Planomicrobium okeanokoites]|uniref:Uncharacterized protein n=1 Tax=Planomicrobium okeanokoites TaxID=244 RepID=A0ABV7KRM6_PLAOK|nr:hypothetical protein [Planomicrobium okeanokoites]TAA69931.1 hypothetical protein D2910_05555 [Planomicrobium okeanokoites]
MERYTLYQTYRLGILIDFFKTKELIAELDEFIEETPTEDIPHVFYVLSLASDRRTMIQLLTDLSQGVDDELPASIIVGLLYRDQEQYTTEELYRKTSLLASLLKDPDGDVAWEFRTLNEANEEAQLAYGMRFKRKKTRERMLAKNEKALRDALAKYAKYAAEFDNKNWGK